jgi:tetratricopeptide (TPR) repeat protein
MVSGSSGTSPNGGQRRHYDIFVSSTSRDLIRDYRPAARRAIEILSQHPIMMEDFGAHDGDATHVSTAEVAAADLLLLILAWRYGYVPAGETRSVTHLEYLEARRLDKPVLVFLAAPESEERDDLFPHESRDPVHHTDLLAFRDELEHARVAAYFSTPDELERAVTKAVSGWLQSSPTRRAFPRVVPEAVRDFVGREDSVARLMETLRGGTSAAISALVAGMGGVGKSALAGEVLRRLSSDPTAFPGGLALVRCNDREGFAGLAWIYDQVLAEWSAALTPAEVAATEGDPEAAAAFRERALRSRLRLSDASGPLPALVLLDNVEEGLPLARALAALGQAGLTALVTARHLPTLSTVALLRLDVLDPDPAAALFAARYQERGGAWDAARDAAPTAQIVALLGGLPLAIELAAADAALEGQGVAALAAQLAEHDRLDPLIDPADPTDPTKSDPTKSVRVTFSQSFEKLAEPLRIAFAALGLPAGNDWPREVIEGMLEEALADLPGAPPPAEVLRRLAARSLLTLASELAPAIGGASADAAPTPRVRLHPLLREYAGEQYDALPAARQTSILVALMEAVAVFTGKHRVPTAAAFAILAREEPLIAETIGRAAEAHAALQALISAVNGLFYYIDVGGHWQVGEAMGLRQLAALREGGDRRGEGVALNNLGFLADSQGRFEEAARYYTEALGIRREVGDRAGEGSTLNNLGELARSQERYDEAARYYEESLAIRHEVGDRLGEGVTLSNLGTLAQNQGRFDEAERYYEEALTVARAVGDRAGEGITLSNLGGLAQNQGHFEEAERYYIEALAVVREVGNRAVEGATLNNLGALAYSQGRYADALRYQLESLAIARAVGDRYGEAVQLSNVGDDYERLGEFEQARDYKRQSLALFQELGFTERVERRGRDITRLDIIQKMRNTAPSEFPALPAKTPPPSAPSASPSSVAPTWPASATPPAEVPPQPPDAEPAPTPPMEMPTEASAEAPVEVPAEAPVAVGGDGKPRRRWWPFGRG